ncbi:nucleotidyltransferase family protein [bacterium]|nr:nucleotidyltransferase family protein [bacterium]
MQAIVLAAGFGTRLKPLTNTTPKPLIPVNGVPLIVYNLLLLKKNGIKDIVINLHYLGKQIEDYLGDGKKLGLKIRYSYEPKILGTGGGIKKASLLFKNKKPFFVLNGDIIHDVPLKKMWKAHQKKKTMATLCLIESPLSKKLGTLYVNSKKEIISVLERPASNYKTLHTFFTGIHIINPETLKGVNPKKPSCIIRNVYIPRLKQGQKLGAFLYKGYWNDLGTLKSLAKTRKDIEKGKVTFSFIS